jgi:hypothetical protein
MAQPYHHDQQSITLWMGIGMVGPGAVPKVS